jgi:hypothetical protein
MWRRKVTIFNPRMGEELEMQLVKCGICLLVSAAFAGCHQRQPFDEPQLHQGAIGLQLRSVEPVALGSGWFLRCKVVVQNWTGTELKVKTHTWAAFSSMDIVVIDKDRKELQRRSCSLHVSTYDLKGKWTPLPVGDTYAEMDFVLGDIPQHQRECQVFIVGKLPESGYKHRLTSNRLEVRLP